MPVTLYDAYNRPIRRNELTREIAAASLTGVRTVWNETVASGLTPTGLAALLRSAADGDHDSFLTLAEEMEERDLHYACELGKRKLAVARLPITVEAASDSARDTELADAVRAMVKKAGFRWMLKDLLDALGKGFAVVEILWDRSGERWMPRAYEHRDPRWFCWDRVSRRQIRLRDEANAFDGIELAPYKFLRHTPRIKSGIPIRAGFARLAAWAYMCKGYTLKDWLAFAEVFGMPLRMGKYNAGADAADIDILKLAVANLGSDAAAVFPQGMEIELVEATKSGSTDFFERLAQYLDNQVTKGLLGQTATTQGTPGKLGNEEAQNEVRHDFRDDDAEQLEETVQRDLIQPFIDLNFGPQENYPQIQLRATPPEDIAALADALEKLVPLGLRVEASVIRDKLGLPDPADSAEVLAPPAAPAPIEPKDLKGLDANAQLIRRIQKDIALALNQQTSALDDIDLAAEEAAAEWRPMLVPLIDPVRQALESATDADDFARRMAEVVANQDPTALVNALARELFRQRGEGEVGDAN
jgi:phage gp29-like protein